MHRSTAVGGLLAVAMMALAGCTGGFEVHQTEPFRVQVDGAPQNVTVREGGEAQRVTVETADVESDTIEVEVTVTKVSEAPCIVHVTIEGEDGESLAEQDIEVGGNETAGNETGNVTGDDETGDDQNVIVQNIVVNVKGKDNVVVVSEAQQGDAEVNIAARGGMANQDGNQTVDDADDNGPY